MPDVGEYVKVRLLGESPWAEVIEGGEASFKGRIDNRLLTDMTPEERDGFASKWFGSNVPFEPKHEYHQNDELYFVETDPGFWVPLDDVRRGALNA